MDFAALKSSLTSSKTVALIKKITFLVGILAMFCGSIFYMVVSDLGFGNEASWLIIATIFSMGSAICQFFSTNMKDRSVTQIILRSVATVAGIGFILFLHLFMGTDFYKGISYKYVDARDVCMVVTLILSYVSVVAQIANLALIITVPEE